MKKVLWILLIVFILAAAGVTVFALTFDADRYRPLIVNKIEESTGFTVDLERISLGWEGGVALKLRQMALFLDKEKQKKLGQFESFSVLVDLMPLLNRRLEVGSILIKDPDIQLVRGPDGKLKGFEKLAQGGGPKANTGEKVTGAILLSAIRRAEIENGRFNLLDQSGGYITNTSLEHIDLTVKDFSLAGDVAFTARAAFASPKQNIQISGRLRAQPLEITHAEFETDLGEAQMDEVLKMFPALRSSGLQKVQGRLSGIVDGLKPEPALSWEKGEVHLSNGRLQLAGTPSLENLELRAGLSQNQIDIQQLSGNLGEGDFSWTGKVDQTVGAGLVPALPGRPQGAPLRLAFKGGLHNLNLSQFASSQERGAAGFGGKLGLLFEGTATGNNDEAILKTLSGQGQLNLDNGVIQNLNVLREVFNRLSMIPGLVQRLQQSLPPAYQEKLQARDTYLQPVQLPFTVNQGVIFFNNLNIAADSFALAGGQGSISPQYIRVQAVLLIDAELSTALVRSVSELSNLQDREGRLSIPVNIQGPPNQISALPDLQYVGSRLATQVLANYLSPRKTADPNATGESAPSSGLDSLRKMKGKDLLAQFLGGSSSGQDSSAQQQ